MTHSRRSEQLVIAWSASTSAQWSNEFAMHHAFSTALGFPACYGPNLDALDDCLGDVAELDYGWTESDTGLIIVIGNFDRFHATMPKKATAVLDIVSRTARLGALLGNRMM